MEILNRKRQENNNWNSKTKNTNLLKELKKKKKKRNNLENHETSVLAAPKWTHKIFSNLLPIEPPCSKLANYTELQKFKNKINLQQKRAEK